MRNKPFTNYPDDADYTTNANSYYDDLARKQKLIELLAKRIWEYEETLDLTLEEISNRLESYIDENDLLMSERLENWDKRIEEMSEEMSTLFVTWLNDGTLEQIINHDVLGNKADQSELDNTNTLIEQMPKKYPVLNILDFLDENYNGSDISDTLHQIMSEYDSAEIKFPAGEYFIDVTNRTEIGNDYYKSFVFKGDYQNTIIKVNSYVGGSSYLSFKASLQVYDLIIDGMVNENKDVLKKNLMPYFSGVLIAKNCIFRNLNGNLEFNRDRRVLLENNIFQSILDHAIYVRQTQSVSSDEQDLIIRNNVFKGTGIPSDYNSSGGSDPRHAIKIVGALNNVDISNNVFDKNFGDIMVSNQETNMSYPKNVSITNNVFNTPGDTIDLFGTTSNVNHNTNFTIKGNTFNPITLPNRLRKVFIYVAREINYIHLIIEENTFNGDNSFSTIRSQDSPLYDFEITVRKNTFKETTIYVRGVYFTLYENDIINCTSFLNAGKVHDFIGNKIIGGSNIIASPFGYISNYMFVDNVFINTQPFVKDSYIYGGRFFNNTFKGVNDIFNRVEGSISDSMSGDFIFSNNNVIGSVFTTNIPTTVKNKVNENNNNFLLAGNTWATKLP